MSDFEQIKQKFERHLSAIYSVLVLHKISYSLIGENAAQRVGQAFRINVNDDHEVIRQRFLIFFDSSIRGRNGIVKNFIRKVDDDNIIITVTFTEGRTKSIEEFWSYLEEPAVWTEMPTSN